MIVRDSGGTAPRDERVFETGVLSGDFDKIMSDAVASRNTSFSATPRQAPVQRGLLTFGGLVLMVTAIWLASRSSRLAVLFLVGALLGVTLHHAAYSFTSAYRRMFVYRDVAGVRTQLVMLAIATCLFAPALAAGTVFGQEVGGALAPVGWSVVAGAFLFGIGMQLGGGCGSGTLYTVGGGSVRMVVTLAAFIAGSFWASLHMSWWLTTPAWEPIALVEILSWPVAVAVQLGWLIVLAIALKLWGKAQPPPVAAYSAVGWRRVLTGPWPLTVGAMSLALLNFLTLIIAGHPWAITWGFTLWGAKIAALLGWNPASSPFWASGFQQGAFIAGVFEDVTSIMDIGIILGAFCAATLAGRFAPTLRIAKRAFAAAVIGGFAMGYGARIAFGCNIGAFFSGAASTSLHGWLWIAAALPGTWVGVRLRPYFGSQN